MTSAVSAEPAFDIEALLAPVPGEQPAGDPRAFAHGLREQLAELARHEDPDDYDDATRPEKLKKSDWPGVLAAAGEALRTQSKDLRVACHLIEALVRLDGLAGLRQGLLLLRRLIDECWDRLNPPIDDGDLEARAEPLANMLDDPIRGLCFPNIVRTIPVLGSAQTCGAQACGAVEWERLIVSKTAADEQAVDAILAASSPERLAQHVSDADECLAELRRIGACLEQKLGGAAPGFVYLGQAIDEVGKLSAQVLRQIAGGKEQQPAAASAENAESAAATALPVGGEVQSRREAYEQIDRAADLLRRLEPHSPVPYLVKRAVSLGRMPFPTLIKQLVREENILSELYRELGIAAGAPDGDAKGASAKAT
jgi:type VI secretion system protein ImpA